MAEVKAGIINITGYIGMELARLLHQHPKVKLTSVTGRSAVGQKVGEALPHLDDIKLTIKTELDKVDFVFSALPHGESAATVITMLEQGVKVVDVSADFRLKDATEYEQWYKIAHPAAKYLEEAVYGLTELNRDQVAAARLVANPGCYPTGAILALVPAVKAGLVEPDIVIDSKSGVSGAGRALSLTTHYAEVNENVSAYALEGHRHLPEMVQELKRLAAEPALSVTFLPHLIPMTRGILTSCYAKLKEGKLAGGKKGGEEVMKLYQDFYRGEPFVRVVSPPPQTKQTWGNNLCLIHPAVDSRTGRLIVVSCIDNLVKGGAGQAVQNMNLMLGFPETTGLDAPAVYP
ncbi:MAG TPA: N-acetyl-gamma-glutamyl-phosphate reductase [Dehalococcoidia bacterium]|nr:N-acetyl-gamma-glutamyl-phosphate reductase [Dehalococcoidia bacterium]